MKLREMLDNCFSNMPDQIAWRMATSDGGYDIVDYPEYMTMFVPGEVVYLMDYEVKEWIFYIRDCRLFVDLYKEEKSPSVVEDTQENHEEEEEEEEEE